MKSKQDRDLELKNVKLEKQLAEKNRELEIEVSLERVRTVAMAMQSSEELNGLVGTVFEELTKLDFVLARCLIMIFDPETLASRWWMANSEAPAEPMNYLVQNHNNPAYDAYLKAWTERTLKWRYALKGKVKKDWDDFLFVDTELAQLPGPVIEGMKAPEQVLLSASFNNFGCLTLVSLEPLSDEHSNIMLRFAKVFDMCYTRFNDLKQAESQTMESQIQLALERVRSRTMAMHNSEDVADTVVTMFNELVKLGLEKTARCGISIIYDKLEMELWRASYNNDGKAEMRIGRVDMTIHPSFRGIYRAWKNNDAVYSYELTGKDQQDYFRALNDSPNYPVHFDLASLPVKQVNTLFFFPEGCLFAFTLEPLPEETAKLFKRFAGVFGQTYRRYLDLQKAEAQVKESQIQLALERVRARTMAMQKSDELREVIQVVYDQLVQLGTQVDQAGFGMDYRESDDWNLWIADQGHEFPDLIHIPYFDTSQFNLFIEARDNGLDHFSNSLAFEEKNKFFEECFKHGPVSDEVKEFIYSRPGWFTTTVLLKNVTLFISNFDGAPYSEAEIAAFMRFGNVFEQTYRRYLDLQKAEEQAREATIEAALERVRGKALAMYTSSDLTSTASMVFTELRKLGINPIRCGVGMVNNKSPKMALYSATTSAAGDSLGLLGWVMLKNHPVLDKIYESLLNNEDYFPVLKGKQLKSYYENLLSGLSLPTLPDFHPGEVQYGHLLPFADGCLYAWAEKRYNEAEIRILKRFTSVIDLTFRRYVELQKSEASARDAVRAASLDRVRADIASMRKQSDLERITPLIWDELTILGIPFIRCGVFIMDEDQKMIHTFLSTPDGKAIGAFHIPFDTSGNFEKMVASWRNKEPYIDHWKEKAFSQFADALVKQGAISSKAEYMQTLPHEGVHLNFLPFLQGMLYVGNIEPLAKDNINLIQAVADAFSTAYARYEDFNKLEVAKKQVDNTLSDLKATQTRLIQSEKMASLGELTAGIAHEIQNPLNFVNNFSEVNQEMIDELADELKAGNIEEALAIAADIKDNEQKISHHGKRADGIVKGMLQHSRTGGGEKQPTDINALADEFMRLSYHGLRAKDKMFNAELVTNFDPDTPKISVIPQDIGRVFLNLFNNAFYAVNQKVKAFNSDFKPEVTVRTTTEDSQVIIKVKDNGVGMPEHIKEKIMQPFFTTKPTGEGTGLGLSLTYDMVVKGHGGTIQVNSIEGEGSEFIIQLPIG